MSETPKPTEESLTPEKQRAFRGVYSALMKLNATAGKSMMVIGSSNDILTTVDLRNFPDGYEGYRDNAKRTHTHLSESNGDKHPAHLVTLDEEAAHETGVLGTITIYEGRGSHPCRYYTLRDGQVIDHARRSMVPDEGEDPADEDHLRHVEVEHFGQMNVEQMEELQAMLETAES